MSIRDLLASLRRRWVLLLVGLAVTAGLCVGVVRIVPVSYEATASVLLLPPKTSVGTRGNPYLYLGGLGQAVEVMAARINAPAVLTPIEDAHPNATIEAGLDTSTTGPIFAVNVTSSSNDDALATMQQVMATVPTTLSQLQDELGIVSNSRISALVLTQDATSAVSTKTRDRALILVAGAGAAGTVLVIGLVDGLLLARRRERLGGARQLNDHRAGEGAPAGRGPAVNPGAVHSPDPDRSSTPSPVAVPEPVVAGPAELRGQPQSPGHPAPKRERTAPRREGTKKAAPARSAGPSADGEFAPSGRGDRGNAQTWPPG